MTLISDQSFYRLIFFDFLLTGFLIYVSRGLYKSGVPQLSFPFILLSAGMVSACVFDLMVIL